MPLTDARTRTDEQDRRKRNLLGAGIYSNVLSRTGSR